MNDFFRSQIRRAARLFFSAVIVLPAAVPAVALDPEVPIFHYTHEQWTTGEGLPQSSPQVLLQDRTGYLWIGTQEGLARFDGVHFRVFNRRSTPPLPANNVTAIFPYSDGRLLVGMRGGGVILLAADGSIENSFHDIEGTRTFLVRSILEDHRHRVWIGTRGSGLFCLHTAVRPVMESVPEFNDNRILALMEASDGTIWVGTEGHGIALIRPGGEVQWLSRVGPSGENTIWALHEGKDGSVWAGSFGDGLIQYSMEGRQIGRLNASDGLSSDRILSLTEDRAGNFWVGTSRGLDRIRAGKITGNSRASALEGEVILSIFEDRQGNLWVGTQRSGLHRLGDSLFSVLPPIPGKALPMARVLCEDRAGALYFGTSGQGLLRLDPGERASAIPESVGGFEGKDIFALYPDPAGPLWIGTYEAGLYRLSGSRISSWTTSSGLPVDTIWAIEGDGRGGIWLGTYGGGLVHFHNGVRNIVSTDDGLPTNLVRCLRLGRDGELWVGLSSGGLVVLREGIVSRPEGAESLDTKSVLDIIENKDGSLWLATAEAGLCLFRKHRLGCITPDQGLFDDKVYRILDDGEGHLWMSSNRGVFRVNDQEARRCAFDHKLKIGCRILGRPEGMPTAECNGGSQPCGWRDHASRLWFPTPEGFVAFRPDQITQEAPEEPALIEAILLGTKELHFSTEAIEIPPGSAPLEIDYTLLDLKNPERIRFQYRLKGLHDDWIDAGTRRAAYFDHLPPGNYHFVVRGGIGESWGPPSTAVMIRVLPSLTQRPAFYLALLLSGILGVIFIAALRVRSHKKRARELETRIAEATRELRSTSEELEKANLKLAELARRDALTGLANRRSFDESLATDWERCRRERQWLSLLMIDIDHFKAFNDSRGHQEGDAALVQVAGAMRQQIRRVTDLVARYGGEEFSVILPNTRPETAEIIAKKLHHAVRDIAIPHEVSPGPRIITISVGVASIIPSADSSPDELIRRADEALYRAKAGGRDRVETS